MASIQMLHKYTSGEGSFYNYHILKMKNLEFIPSAGIKRVCFMLQNTLHYDSPIQDNGHKPHTIFQEFLQQK
jgi:hypothetical protein